MSRRTLVLVLGLLGCAAPSAYAQTAECSDGSTSYSTNFRGTCSHHGGVAVWNDEMKDEANQWCDDNPSLCDHSHWAGIGGHGNHPEGEGDASELQPRREQKPACDRHFPMDCPLVTRF